MSDIPSVIFWVALGSMIGGPARYFVSGFVGRRIGETFPWGTMTVNLLGAFAIGMAAAVARAGGAMESPAVWQFAVTGFLGSFTTVSSFSLQTMALAQEGQVLRAAGNIVASLVLGIAAAGLGFQTAASTFGAVGG